MADDNLFDRLNALKPTSISLKQPSATLSVTDRPPASREDDLASRLKSLRIAREEEADRAEEAEKSQEQRFTSGGSSVDRVGKKSEAPKESDDDLFADDDAVNDLLMEIAAEQGFGDEDADETEHDGDEPIPLPDVPSSDWLKEGNGDDGDDDDSGNEEHSKQVEELLQRLEGTPLKRGQLESNKREEGDSDDSDGDTMKDEIRRVLERAKDEAALEVGEVSTGKDKNAPNQTREDPLGLPSVPTSFADFPEDNELGLPSAPTQDLPERGADDDISQRLAGLRGLRGKAAGLGETDSFGLPSAPTFKPGDEGGVLKKGHYGFGRVNYTDEDQQTWCIVCLEDATIRCVGCAEDNANSGTGSNNAYCEGCWRDMHVGPSAGFDERGHMRVPLKKTPWP